MHLCSTLTRGQQIKLLELFVAMLFMQKKIKTTVFQLASSKYDFSQITIFVVQFLEPFRAL